MASPRRRPLVLLAAALLAALAACAPDGLEVLEDATPAAPSTAPSSSNAAGEEGGLPLAEAIAQLRVAEESRSGYDRGAFKHWVDEDGDGCDARAEVLLAEAVTAPEQGERCRLTGGQWLSYYDGETVTDPSRLDIDHVVPLAEAWDSGASN